MTSNLIIIYTIFDGETKTYLNLFGLDNNINEPKSISFNHCKDNISSENNIDVLLLPDDKKTIFEDKHDIIIAERISKAENIFLVLHKGGKDENNTQRKDECKKYIFEYGSQKLKLPIIEEHHTHGNTFNFLVKLGGFYKKRDQKFYEQELIDFIALFNFNKTYEATLQILEQALTNEGIDRLLEREVYQILIASSIYELLDDKKVQAFLANLKGKTGKQRIEIHKQLTNYLFEKIKPDPPKDNESLVSKNLI